MVTHVLTLCGRHCHSYLPGEFFLIFFIFCHYFTYTRPGRQKDINIECIDMNINMHHFVFINRRDFTIIVPISCDKSIVGNGILFIVQDAALITE